MITEPIPFEAIGKYIREGLKKDVERIIEEEVAEAQRKVASRVMEMKQQAVANILNKFRMTRVENPDQMQIVLKFEV